MTRNSLSSSQSNDSGLPLPAVKNRADLDKLSKPKLIDYAVELGSTLSELRHALLDPTTGLVPILQRQAAQLESQLAVSQSVNKTLLSHLGRVEKTANENSQYARRETLEIHGIPESFGNGSTLEKKVIDLLNDVVGSSSDDSTGGIEESDVPLVPGNQSYAEASANPYKLKLGDFHAIHRLYRKDRVIIKFTNRRIAKMVAGKKNELKKRQIKAKNGITNSVYLNESMCPAIKKLFYQCKLLKAAGKIALYSFSNGTLRVKKYEDDVRKFSVAHISDLAKVTGMTQEEIEKIVDPQSASDQAATNSQTA